MDEEKKKDIKEEVHDRKNNKRTGRGIGTRKQEMRRGR